MTSVNVLVDPGQHAIIVGNPDGKDAIERPMLAAGSTTVLEFPLTKPEPAAPAPAPVALTTAPPPPAGETEGAGPDRTWAYVAFGVGAAGLITGSVFGALALDKKSDLDDGPCSEGESACTPGSQGDIDTLDTRATISTIGFAVGGAGAVAGLVLWLMADGTSSEQVRDERRVTPWIAGNVAGVRGAF
jgi:hypothetical protein